MHINEQRHVKNGSLGICKWLRHCLACTSTQMHKSLQSLDEQGSKDVSNVQLRLQADYTDIAD